ALEMTKYAFELSERLKLPVFLRLTARICHSSYDVVVGEIKYPKQEAKFIHDKDRYVMIANRSRARQPLLENKRAEARGIFASDDVNTVTVYEAGWKLFTKPYPLWAKAYTNPMGDEKEIPLGIIAAGITAGYVHEAVKQMKLSAAVLSLRTTIPVPVEMLSFFISRCREVAVIEELEPLVEHELRAYLQRKGESRKVWGKDEGLMPTTGEFNVDMVSAMISKITGVPAAENLSELKEAEELASIAKPRIPGLCAGCPHRASYYALEQAAKKTKAGVIVCGDRGCYNQGAQPPLNALDTCICMGASISMASGFYHSKQKEKAVAVIGDGTFFHAGIPSLLNAVHNRSDITVMILDNRTTAMTGRQPNPGTGKDALGRDAPAISLEEIVSACGVKWIQSVNAFETKKLIDTIQQAIEYDGPAVVISKGPCINDKLAEKGVPKIGVVSEKCIGCKKCLRELGCLALSWDTVSNRAKIESWCNGCGLCATVCPVSAINVIEKKKVKEEKKPEKQKAEAPVLTSPAQSQAPDTSGVAAGPEMPQSQSHAGYGQSGFGTGVSR
ncbi:MAG: thiamine pyrophosphate-dependent enzyme, partial [Thermoplasmata archaeon]